MHRCVAALLPAIRGFEKRTTAATREGDFEMVWNGIVQLRLMISRILRSILVHGRQTFPRTP
jgi:hypothetical protein